jgi:5-methylcytosine-specific restriction endonuclease McrA
VAPSGWTYETNGEHFAAYLLRNHIDGESLQSHVPLSLLSTGRGMEWSEALREMTVLHLERRLIAAASALCDRSPEWDSVVERDIKQMIIDTMTVDYFEVSAIYERLVPAVRSARQTIRAGVHRELESEAKRVGSWCYLCGADLDFIGDQPTSFTLDHVWPRAYGGNSDPENLLPACESCNARKGNVPSWALYPIQALVAGYQLEASDFELIPKEMRFAVLARSASKLAESEGVSLKEAYVVMGRPTLFRIADMSTSVDVFNLVAQVT